MQLPADSLSREKPAARQRVRSKRACQHVSLAVEHNNGLVGALRKRGNVRNERQAGAIKTDRC